MELKEQWSENIIIVDADYVDAVAFDLIVNFERMIGRHIPQADIALWLDCIALDGGVKEVKKEAESNAETEGMQLQQTQVIFIHDGNKTTMKNFTPGKYKEDLDGKAFQSRLGEFLLSSYKVETVVSKEDFMLDVLLTAANHKDVKRVMYVSNTDASQSVDMIRHTLRDAPDDKRITVFSMQPIAGGNFRQEILGYSLMAALGIRSGELDVK